MRKALFVLAAAAALWLVPGALASGWCGTGETTADRPDLVTGPQVHAVAVIPSDAVDTFATVAPKLADDVASITSWWASQDPTRVPRFDIAAFPGGNCLDISFVRLPDPASAYRGSSNAFSRMTGQLQAAGFLQLYKKYYVYYDGPSVQTSICGTGGRGTFSEGPSYAVVWLNGCPSVPDDSVGAHELLHALGALPAGAPHACPGDSGHPCDSTTDLLYPSTSGQPLSAQVLDFNHDDYYGHSGTWLDLQDSLWMHRLDLPSVTLDVQVSGGTGVVSSDLPGVDCSAACTTQWDSGSLVTLTAQPADGGRFVRWAGSCTGPGDCVLKLDQAASVTAVFGPLRVPLKLTTAGNGTVACTPGCAKTVDAGDRVVLRAVPAKGWKFKSWSGGCTGTRPTCSPNTDAAVAVRATFRRK